MNDLNDVDTTAWEKKKANVFIYDYSECKIILRETIP